MSLSWAEIEGREGFAGSQARANAVVAPILLRAKPETERTSTEKRVLQRALSLGTAGFGISFLLAGLLVPDDFLGWVLRPFLFVGLLVLTVVITLWSVKDRLFRLMFAAAETLGVKADAMRALIEPFGLTYVPAPGSRDSALAWVAKQPWAPAAVKALAARLEAGAGMDAAVEAAIAAGVMMPENSHVLGRPDQRAGLVRNIARTGRTEDGMRGRWAGLAFDAFEWVEWVKEGPEIHHFIIVLSAPVRLHGVTQLRSRRTGWPAIADAVELIEVDLGPRAFDALYKLRASDQVEARAIFNPAVIERVIALAHGDRFRAAARGAHLVFDFIGTADRFSLINVLEGSWSDDSLRSAYGDLAEMLDLIAALGHAFMVARNAGDDPA